MTKIYTSLDIGSYEIKLLVFELINNKFYLLGQFTKKSKGIKKGRIDDFYSLTAILKQLFSEAEKSLNCHISKVIVAIANVNTNYKIISKVNELDIEQISGSDVTDIMKGAVVNQLSEYDELISFVPIEFKIDGGVTVKNPLGMSCSSIEIIGMMISQPKNQIHDIIGLLSGLNIEVVDMVLSSIGDYYSFRNVVTDTTLGAVINIGFKKTEITMFKVGIPFISDSINMGSFNVDYDLSYINNISLVGARRLKEDFVLATTDRTSVKEVMNVRNNKKEEIVVNQKELSDIAIARLEELMNNIKDKINALTNLPVSYIIITGGLTELVGFRKLCNEEFGSKVIVGNIMTMGIRNNKFSVTNGIVRYFNEKMLLREKEYSMFSSEDVDGLVTVNIKPNMNQTNVINKFIGNFVNNKEE